MDEKQLKKLFEIYNQAVLAKDIDTIEKCTNILKQRLSAIDRKDENLSYLLKKIKRVHIDAQTLVAIELEQLKQKMEGIESNKQRDMAYTKTQLTNEGSKK
ncbi:hypothetical protein [Vibrio algivorus]|uniref:Flagellar protein FliT n=1 Tax=Vibrio algivorus TaxID=1667024 RepID=A0A557NV30_9VIBR|nr:hypothetical protein [Vibrio algivorus]TVO32280.1 hypothetical protein FOF44_17170 [Vibrio algivorus]